MQINRGDFPGRFIYLLLFWLSPEQNRLRLLQEHALESCDDCTLLHQSYSRKHVVYLLLYLTGASYCSWLVTVLERCSIVVYGGVVVFMIVFCRAMT